MYIRWDFFWGMRKLDFVFFLLPCFCFINIFFNDEKYLVEEFALDRVSLHQEDFNDATPTLCMTDSNSQKTN